MFIPNTDVAVTGTEGGDILVFDKSLIVEGIGDANEKRLIKIVTLNTQENPFCGINMITTVHDRYLVVGNSDGSIRFYDFMFKIVAWFEDLNLATVKAISFSRRNPRTAEKPNPPMDKLPLAKDDKEAANRKVDHEPFSCSDFIVADSSAMVVELQSQIFEAIEPQKKKGTTIMHGLRSSVSAIAVSPVDTILAVAGSEGYIILWNYVKKGDPQAYNFGSYNRAARDKPKAKDADAQGPKRDAEGRRILDKNKLFTTIDFTPDGTELIICQNDSLLNVMDLKTAKFKDLTMQLSVVDTSKQKPSYITQLVMCNDGPYFACSDSNRCVSLFKKEYTLTNGQIDQERPKEWQFSGKIRSHQIEIAAICFGKSIDENDQVQQRLFSVGRDRRCFEYDVREARCNTELPILREFMVEMEAHPTCCAWYPQLDFKEGILLTTNDEYKIKLWNPTTQTSRRTCLGPTYGGEIVKLKLLEQMNGEKYMCYATESKVIGLIKLPLDGNPHKTMGLIAHPNEVTDLCVTSDGKYVFTCGGDDLAVNMWAVDVTPINQAVAMGGEGIEPFVNLIEGGREGQTFQDMKDFFYYSMIKAQVEDTTKTRKLTAHVPVE